MEQQAEEILAPVLEGAIIAAAQYATACGRSTLTKQDMKLGLMFAARNITGNQIGTFFPEEDSDEEEDEDEIETVDDADEPFTQYTGDEDLYKSMNECARTWDEWTPESPAERALKNAVDKV
jgi:hypothetical protein